MTRRGGCASHRAAPVALALSLAWASTAQAQEPVSAAGESAQRWPVAVWGSAGLGPGDVRTTAGSGLLAVATRLTASVGPLLLTYRGNDIVAVFSSGDGVRDTSLLLGGRTGGRRVFGSAAMGYGSATPRHDCENCGTNRTGASAGVLAFDLVGHVNYLVPGLAVAFSGTAGPARVSYSSVTINLELGWFGW